MRHLSVWALVFVLWAPALSAREVQSGPRYHVVYSGQRLGSIAKRYKISVEALRTANALDRSARIRPGQKLLIPDADDPDGSKARAHKTLPEKHEASPREPETRTAAHSDDEASGEITHRVYSGQRLASIAKRYRISVDELCAANKIDRHATLRVGQVLVIPGQPQPTEQPSERATATRQAVTRGSGSWHKYARGPRRKGYVELQTYTRRYRGQVVDSKGKLSKKAASAISDLLGAGGTKPSIDPRLIQLLVQVSDKFGGRPIRIVSGYRTRSFFNDSRHKTSRAVDFSVPGVPNEVVRDYLRTFRNAGVGFYPNSTFLHLDVRKGSTYWVDLAGPGEAPRRDKHRRQPHNHEAEVGEAEVVAQEQRGGTAMPLNTATASETLPSEAARDSAGTLPAGDARVADDAADEAAQ